MFSSIHTPLRWLICGSCLVLMAWFISPGLVNAQVINDNDFKVSGFLTLGATRGGDEFLGFRRFVSQEGVFEDEWSYKTDSVIGVQFDKKFTSNWAATVQLVGRERIKNSFKESIDWAFLKYRINPNLTARAGRIGMSIYMLSDYRNVGFAYLWARPPTDFYSLIAFDYYDGADIVFNAPLGSGTFKAKFLVGSSENKFRFNDSAAEFKLNNMFGASLLWENQTWRFRYGFLSFDFDDSINQVLGTDLVADAFELADAFGWDGADNTADDIRAEGESALYHALGFVYEKLPWTIQGEISYLDTDYDVIKSNITRYISVGYIFDEITVYGMLGKGSQTSSRTKLPDLPDSLSSIPLAVQLRDGAQLLYNASYADQESIAAGARWDLRYDIALKMQLDHIRVEENGTVYWASDTLPDKDRAINIVSINLNYIF
ncbi:MAG: hypothetical protein MI867_20715 [Pseudomonadales bacterium]|nr:hypothetical protein [Pseudomonadales bacterium]